MNTQNNVSNKAKETKKTIINLTSKEANNAFIEAKKEALKNDTSISLDFLKELDKLNLKTKEEDLKKESTKGANNGNYLYKYELLNLNSDEKTTKRKNLRKQKNAICNNLILAKKAKNVEKLKLYLNTFLDFYKKEFILNDFSLNSFCAKNTDDKHKNLYSDALEIVKLIKDKI